MHSDYNIEQGLISKLLETKDITTLKDAQITPKFFSGEDRRVFSFIYDSILNSGEVPTERAIKAKFPNYDLYTYSEINVVGTEESLKYWCNEIRAKAKHNSLADTLEKAVEKIQDFETDKAYELLKSEIAHIESDIEEQLSVDITKETEFRKLQYLEKKKNKGMQGIPYGIPSLDFLTKGLKKETLTTLIAKSGVGKTWFEVLIGSYCMLQNCRVLQFVTEMSEDIMRDRYEAMLFGMCYGKFNYNSFKSGSLSPEDEKRYFRFLDEDLPNFEPLIIATATGVMGVSAEIDKYKPDLVLIDGVYLMEDDQRAESDWLRVAHITRDLKKLAKRAKIPILINSQADKNTSKKIGPELDSISYSQAVGQDSDDVLALFRDEVMIEDREMCLKVLKQREGTLGKVTLNWDFKNMNFTEIYCESTEQGFSDDKEDGSNTLGVD